MCIIDLWSFMNTVERRNLDRFKIPGAKVLYYPSDGLSIIVSLTDISKSSIRFELTSDIKVGDIIDFELIIPSNEKILLKGHVTWIGEEDPLKDSYYVVARFAPFGSDARYNSTHSYEQLNKIFKEHLESLKDS